METFKVAFFVMAVTASVLAYPGVQHHRAIGHDIGHKFAYPKYNFKYGVNSGHTGDVKSHWESRDGDIVKGSYSLNEPDGTIRQVDYTADKHGYKAVVKKIGHVVQPKTTTHHHYEEEASYLGNGHHAATSYSTANRGIHHFGSSRYSTGHFGGAHISGGHSGAISYSKGSISTSKHYSVPKFYGGVSTVTGVGHHNGAYISGGHPGGATSYTSVNRSFGHLGSSQYSTGHFGGAYISERHHAGASSYINGNTYHEKHYPVPKTYQKISTVTGEGHHNGATSYSKRKDLSLSHFIGHHF